MTGLSWTTSTWRSLCSEPRPLTGTAGRHIRRWGTLELIHLRAKAPSAPRTTVVRQTIRQTVVNHWQVSHRHVLHQSVLSRYLQADAFLLLLPPPWRAERAPAADLSHPTRTARRLLRLFSMESARRQLRPFYRGIVHSVLREEQDRFQSRPAQAISLLWTLFGRQQAFRTLTRFYLSAVEKLGSSYYPALRGQNALYLAAGVVLHSQVYRRYVRHLWSREEETAPLSYARRQAVGGSDGPELPAVRRAPPTPGEPEEADSVQPGPRTGQDSAPPARGLRLSQAEFRALVQGVASSLGRQARLESLRRGGI